MPELLELKAVSKSYPRGERRVLVLSDVSLAVAAREVAAVVSARHEGRTTLLKIAAGLLRPDAGSVCFRGQDMARLKDSERSALLAEEIAWTSAVGHVGNLEVLHYLTLPLLMAEGHSQKHARRLAFGALERVGAESAAHQRWRELSSWERMLVLLARATVGSPALVVLDDVFDGFGMLLMQQAWDVLRSTVDAVGCAALLSSCDVEAAAGADSVYWCEGGHLKPMAGGATTEASIIEFPSPQVVGRMGGAGV